MYANKKIVGDNTKCKHNFVFILNLPSDTDVTDKVFMDITLDQLAKPTASLFFAFVKIRLN